MSDHSALIERTRPHRFKPETYPAAKARKCDWCARPSLRGETWCPRHAPGLASNRRENKGGNGARLVALRDDYVAESVLSAELKAWAPVARIIAIRPRHTRAVKLVDVVRALVSRASGDHAPWASIVANMREHGFMRDSDRDFAEWRA